MISCCLICGQLVIHLQFGYHSSIGCCKTFVTIDRFAEEGRGRCGTKTARAQPESPENSRPDYFRHDLGRVSACHCARCRNRHELYLDV